MRLPPPEIVASWPAPNTVDPERRGNAVLIVNGILFPLALLIILIRVYTRLKITKSFGLDDWLILAAMLPSTAFAVLATLSELVFKFDLHDWDLPTSRITFGLQLIMIAQIIFTLGQTLTKCSMLAFLYRIFSNGQDFKRITIGAAILITVQGTIFIIVTIFQCRPISHYWLLSWSPQPECINITVHVTFAGILNTLTDCLVVLIPIPKMLNLQMPLRQRLIVIFLFATGFLVCVAGAVRTYYNYIQSISTDISWDTYYVWITACVELYVGIIGTSIPAIKPFFQRHKPSTTSSRTKLYILTSDDKGPFSVFNTIIPTPSQTSRISRTISQQRVELGEIEEGEMRMAGRLSNLDLIEEATGSHTSISNLVDMGVKPQQGKKVTSLMGKLWVSVLESVVALAYGNETMARIEGLVRT